MVCIIRINCNVARFLLHFFFSCEDKDEVARNKIFFFLFAACVASSEINIKLANMRK